MSFEMKADKLRTEIKSIDKARGTLTQRIQVAALACLYHAYLHNEVSLAVELVKAVGAGMKQEALRVWFEKHGPITLNKEDVLKFSRAKQKEGEARDDAMTAASLELWHAADTETKAEAFTLAAGAHTLLNKLNKQIEQGNYTPTDSDKEFIKALESYAVANPKPAKVVA